MTARQSLRIAPETRAPGLRAVESGPGAARAADPDAAPRPLWGVVPPPRPALRGRKSGLASVASLPASDAGLIRATWGPSTAEAGYEPGEAADTGYETGEAPEPLDWRPQPRFRERVLAAVSVPVVVGVVVFAAAVAVAVALALLRSHVPGTDTAATAAALSGSEPAAELLDGTGEAGPADPTGSPAPEAPAEQTVTGGGAAGTAEAAGTAGTAEVGGIASVRVHVVGKVRSPGVVSLPAGSRVEDAIEAVGGATSKAALAALNLARVVVDGEQIVVTKDAAKAGTGGAAAGTAPGNPDHEAGAGTGDASSSGSAPLDLNAADAGALEQLPRIGPALARRIVEWREANGRFANVDQLLQVPGIGAKTLEGLRDGVRV